MGSVTKVELFYGVVLAIEIKNKNITIHHKCEDRTEVDFMKEPMDYYYGIRASHGLWPYLTDPTMYLGFKIGQWSNQSKISF